MKKALSTILIVIMMISIIPCSTHALGGSKMAVYFIDCGQGDAIFITSDNETMLVDAGKASNVQKVLNFLNSLGTSKIDYVFSSHPDEDHIGGMPEVYENYQIDHSIYSSYVANTAIYQKYMTAVKNEPNSTYAAANDGDTFSLGDTKIDVISDGKGYSNANDSSVVLKVTCDKTELLLTGDISNTVEKDLVKSNKDIDVNILKVGHHGSATSSCTEFLTATSPDVAVISVGEGNSYGHPTQEALNRLSAVCDNIHRTDKENTILLDVKENTVIYNNKVLNTSVDSYSTTKTVYVTASGKKYHASSSCSNMKSPIAKSLADAKAQGYTACSKCVSSDFESGDNQVVDGNPFKDVKKSDFYYTPVLWAVENGITSGTSKTTFAPNAACTRGQIATFLWRAAGCPNPKTSKNPFTDVKKSDYYYKAVLWAVGEGITSGATKTNFQPDAPCTRGQIATFLWRSAGAPTSKTSKNPFTDVKKKDYYYKAVLWAVGEGITAGTTKTTFGPNEACTRGQIATFLYRAYN